MQRYLCGNACLQCVVSVLKVRCCSKNKKATRPVLCLLKVRCCSKTRKPLDQCVVFAQGEMLFKNKKATRPVCCVCSR